METPICVKCIFTVQKIFRLFCSSDFLWTLNYPCKKTQRLMFMLLFVLREKSWFKKIHYKQNSNHCVYNKSRSITTNDGFLVW